MGASKRLCVAAYGGVELYEEFDERGIELGREELAQRVVERSGVKTARNAIRTVRVQVYDLYVDKGALKRREARAFEVQLPLQPLSEAEFDAEMEVVLAGLPAEFHAFVRSEAYDRRHSEGMEQTLEEAAGLVEGLARCVSEFGQRVRFERTGG